MTTSMLAFGKASVFGIAKEMKPLSPASVALLKRSYTAGASVAADRNGNGKSYASPTPVEKSLEQRELFVDVLNANATRRDAKQFLARFKNSQAPKATNLDHARNARGRQDQYRLDRMGVNLGSLYAPARAIADTPQFTRDSPMSAVELARSERHVALVSLRDTSSLDQRVLDGLAATLAQLIKLEMKIVLVLGSGHVTDGIDTRTLKQDMFDQAYRLARAIDNRSPNGSRFVSDALVHRDDLSPLLGRPRHITVSSPKLLFDPLQRGMITIVPTLAHTTQGQLRLVALRSVMTALATELAGFSGSALDTTTKTSPYALDRIILLNAVGGIPSRDRNDGAHVFVNLEQEYADIRNELCLSQQTCPSSPWSNPEHHLENLDIANDILTLLPSSSSALIISPQEAAASSSSRSNRDPISAGTRKQRNTLIHNLLTNKPLISSSLPLARFNADVSSSGKPTTLIAPTATLVKKGMPVTIIPGVAGDGVGWRTPEAGKTILDLENDPRVDLSRLIHLINDSFRRKLDVKSYLERISGRIAGLVIAGSYEGAAILTWEAPPGEDHPDPSRRVPYLDKFAVLQSSQGSAGVADIVFQAMVRSCFPGGVCWRSRRDNPVNKWYFERSAGTWDIPDTQWTMFWTGEGVVEDEKRWKEYVAVCRSVVPTWADGKKPD